MYTIFPEVFLYFIFEPWLYVMFMVISSFIHEYFLFAFFRVDVCSLLLSHGADPNLLNCHSKSAVDVCPSDDLQEKLQCKQKALVCTYICSINIIRDVLARLQLGPHYWVCCLMTNVFCFL